MNREHKLEHQRRYREAHKEELREKSRIYREEHREECRARVSHWEKLHPENKRAAAKRWREKHPEKAKAKDKADREKNAEKRKQQITEWREENRGKIQEYNRLYLREHYGEILIKNERRRALKASLPMTLTLEQWETIKRLYGYKCAYCGRKTNSLTKDHVIPLIKGGGTTSENIVPACLSCNSRKQRNDVPKVPTKRLMISSNAWRIWA